MQMTIKEMMNSKEMKEGMGRPGDVCVCVYEREGVSERVYECIVCI